jgi:predicted Zn-dependent protease
MGPLQFLSTHPNPENRVEKIEQYWLESGSKTGKDHSADFRRLQKSLP